MKRMSTWICGCGCFLLAIVLAAMFPLTAMAQQPGATAGDHQALSFSLGQMFTFFFLMLGPLKILAPFAQIARKGDARFARRLAMRAFAFSCAALFLAAAAGENSLRKYHIRVSILAIAAGIILFLVALRTVMEQFTPESNVGPKVYEPELRYAVSPLAFPTIVTPYGVAAVIVCMDLTPQFSVRLQIYGVLLGLMVLNFIAMLFAKPLLKYFGMPLMLFGTVLGVIQVALGLSIIFRGLQALGFGGGS